jgi:hypothetical protein
MAAHAAHAPAATVLGWLRDLGDHAGNLGCGDGGAPAASGLVIEPGEACLKGEGTGATFGTAGVGAASDLCGRLLQEAAGVTFTMVPYKGTGPAMTDLIGEQIHLMCDQTTEQVDV